MNTCLHVEGRENITHVDVSIVHNIVETIKDGYLHVYYWSSKTDYVKYVIIV